MNGHTTSRKSIAQDCHDHARDEIFDNAFCAGDEAHENAHEIFSDILSGGNDSGDEHSESETVTSPDGTSSAAPSEESMGVLMRYMGLSPKTYMNGQTPKPKSFHQQTHSMRDEEENYMIDSSNNLPNNSLIVDDNASVASEASMKVLMRYMGCSSTPYMAGGPHSKQKNRSSENATKPEAEFIHDLREGDHVIRWKILGYCYPIQVHGIVFSVGPDFVTIVDCGWSSSYESSSDKVGKFKQDEKKKKVQGRMRILTLADKKEIKKWTKIRYGEEVQLKVHSSNREMKQHAKDREKMQQPDSTATSSNQGTSDMGGDDSPSAGLELDEVEQCVNAKIKTSPGKSPRGRSAVKRSPSSWFSWSVCNDDETVLAEDTGDAGEKEQYAKQQHEEESKSSSPKQCEETGKAQKLRLPKADPPTLVLARLRFLLEYGEGPFPPPSNRDDNSNNATDDHNSKADAKPQHQTLLPPHHLLYANSECIAVFCKTGNWSTLQAAIFLHSTTAGNVKQTATVAMFLSAQTVTVPATGLWGWFGSTTTVSLFSTQPWLVPALVGGGMVYIGLPMLMLRKAKGRWGDTEKRLNEAFWSMYDNDVIVECIRSWSNIEG